MKTWFNQTMCAHDYRVVDITFDGLMNIQCAKCNHYVPNVKDHSITLKIALIKKYIKNQYEIHCPKTNKR